MEKGRDTWGYLAWRYLGTFGDLLVALPFGHVAALEIAVPVEVLLVGAGQVAPVGVHLFLAVPLGRQEPWLHSRP